MQALRQEMAEYYEAIRHDRLEGNDAYLAKRNEIWQAMDRFAAENPRCHPCLLKARLHEEIAERFEPVIFRHSPFYFEMGLRPAENWGTPEPRSAASWMVERRGHITHDHPGWARLWHLSTANPAGRVRLWNIWKEFDSDHHCLGYTRLLRDGVDGILERIARRQKRGATPSQQAFLEAAERSCRAVLRIARRFAEKAESVLADEAEPRPRRFLEMIAATARRVPAEPPRTFYEALAALWFLREVTASLESIGVSVVGHLDRLLIGYYRADLSAGRLTEAEAADLLARWMLPTDVKFHVDDNPWPETSTCMELGGCDEAGGRVFNELTRLIIQVHRRWGLFNPKLNCRFDAEAPQEVLDLLGECILGGHNHFALLNDDVLIDACLRAGKTQAEARLYVNGGCQETICEGVEHSAGAYYYFNMARVLDLCLQPLTFEPDDARLPPAEAHLPGVIEEAATFEEFYARFLAALGGAITLGADWLRQAGARWHEVLPCPFFSATLEGCLDGARDYTAAGAKYNPAGIALVGLGTVVDSLQAIRAAVFEDGFCTPAELRQALADNWTGHDALRARLVSLPKFGHADAEVDALAARFARDLASIARHLRNERGGPFQPSFFVYYAFYGMGRDTRATPDGRRNADLLSQGIAPGRVRPPQSLTDVLRSLAAIDFRDFPGNSVLDVQLPMGKGISPANLSAVIRTFARMGGPTLQCNCVRVEDMKDAQVHPERHQDLVVRIAGLSARFVALQKYVQDELISRAVLTGES